MNDEVTKGSPWDVFIHLLAVIALYVSAFGALTLLFQYVNLLLPDPADDGLSLHDSIRYGLSMLVIFFPTYWWAWRAIEIDLAANPGKRRLWLRTCPIYLTLFLAGLLTLGDLAWLVYYLLSGDLTSRFVLKIAAILVVAGAVLAFYRDALRREPGSTTNANRALVYAATGFAGALVLAGIATAGSPTRSRLIRLDVRRIRDLELVQQKIASYWQSKGVLPAGLDQLTDDISGFSAPRDPVSGRPYGYNVTGKTAFDLCADFAIKDFDTASTVMQGSWRTGAGSTIWNHDAGHVCFHRTIDPQRYPPKASAWSEGLWPWQN